MGADEARQLEMPAPERPTPTCRACGCKLGFDYDLGYRAGATTYLCPDCYAEPGDYWTRDRAERCAACGQLLAVGRCGCAQEHAADALSPLAQAVRRYAALRAASP